MSHLSLRERLDQTVPLPSLRSSLSPPPSTASTTPPPSYRQRQSCHQSRRQKRSPTASLSSQENHHPHQRCTPQLQETRDHLQKLSKEKSLISALQEFRYLVMRDGLEDAVDWMRWVLLQEGVEIEHNVLGCSYCEVVEGQFVHCPCSVYHPCHVLHDLLVEDHLVCGCEY